ncbi:MAG: hypothetical protein AAFP20_25530 [Cyanobacteria bacterium J06614_10]
MEEQNLKAEESLLLIGNVIASTKARFEQNGKVYLIWGILLTLASAAQFALLQMEHWDIHYYPYLIALLGWVYMFWYYSKAENRTKSKNIISQILNSVWIFVGINAGLLGFLMGATLRENLIPVILIMVSAGVIVSGAALKNRLVMFAGIFCNVAGFVAFWLDFVYQPLLTSIVYFIVLVVPGYIFARKNKAKNAA